MTRASVLHLLKGLVENGERSLIHMSPEFIREIIEALFAGEGGDWVLVPHEPTKSMVSEAVYNTNRKYDKVVVDATIVRQVWSTMMWARPVTAAPQPARTCDCGANAENKWPHHDDCGVYSSQPAQAGAGTECEHRRSTWRLDMSSGTCKDCGAGLLPDGSSTPASPATVRASPFTCDECGKVECCPEFHDTPQPAAAQGAWVMVERSDLEDFRAWASNVLGEHKQ